jgi:HdeA/HdeB family protein
VQTFSKRRLIYRNAAAAPAIILEFAAADAVFGYREGAIMLKKQLLSCVLALPLVMAASYSGAQVTIDVAKISCAQFLKYKVTNPDNVAIWLSGYYHGKQNTTLLAREDFKENIQKLKSACLLPQNSELPVLQVAGKLFVAK